MNASSFQVLGTPLQVCTYASLTADLQALARQQPGPLAVEFANTQIVVLRRHDAAFREESRAFNYFIPDGMPLVWCLNFAGAGLRDRVYGPTFMRKFLETAGESTHYLLGGSEKCGAVLREKFSKLNPRLKFVGSFHGKCNLDGTLEAAAEREVIEEINRLSPDFIWVGLGAPKQQQWIRKHKHLLRRGVVLSVGFAFDVNAGMKSDAPEWMQPLGLTWVYRLCSEPRRLASRYLRYNFLFLFYILWDGLRGRAWKSARASRGAEITSTK
jgi:N-acetylglucosaminyldiphosphoundecaprenol N-acetyl-beta-D-mannosaminyltransferase